MKISMTDLLHLVPADLRPGIHPGTTWSLVTKFYCGPMTTADLCPAECARCERALRSIFREFGVARNPAALLTYRCKNEVAYQRDHHQPHQAPTSTDPYGFPTPEQANPFRGVLEEICLRAPVAPNEK